MQAGFPCPDQITSFFFPSCLKDLLLLFVPARSSLPLSLVFCICSLPMLTGCLTPSFCLIGPHLMNLYFSSCALHAHSACLP